MVMEFMVMQETNTVGTFSFNDLNYRYEKIGHLANLRVHSLTLAHAGGETDTNTHTYHITFALKAKTVQEGKWRLIDFSVDFSESKP